MLHLDINLNFDSLLDSIVLSLFNANDPAK